MSDRKISAVTKHLMLTREILAKPEHWCKGWFILDKNGGYLYYVDDVEAYSFCLAGALRKASWSFPADPMNDGVLDQYFKTLKILNNMFPTLNIAEFNDHRNTTHAKILQFLDEAIAASM